MATKKTKANAYDQELKWLGVFIERNIKNMEDGFKTDAGFVAAVKLYSELHTKEMELGLKNKLTNSRIQLNEAQLRQLSLFEGDEDKTITFAPQ